MISDLTLQEAVPTVQVARQPILAADESHRLLGYELMFRDSGVFGAFADVDDSHATSEVVSHALLTLGIERVVGDALAFIRFPARLLHDGTAMALPAGQTAVEVGPESWRDQDLDHLTRSLTELAEAGYTISLADFTYVPAIEPLLRLARFVKVNLGELSPTARSVLLPMLRKHDVEVIAVKVDDVEQRDLMLEAGVDYVEGFFFSEPRVVRGAELPGFKLAYLQLMQAAYAIDVDYDQLARIIKSDVSLTYKLLRFINSAAFGLRKEVESVGQALALLGLAATRRWVSLATVSGLVAPQPRELAVMAVTRARFCEQISTRLGVASGHECFSLGMFSLLPALLGKSLEETLTDVALSPSVEAALRGEGGPLRDVLDSVIAYERGAWGRVSTIADQRAWAETELIGAYLDAVEWSRAHFSTT